MSWKEDARFVGAFVRGGDWEVGLRIARSVYAAKGPGGSGTANIKLYIDPTAGRADGEPSRVSMLEFADESGISQPTIRRYLAAWEWAAEAGVIDPAGELGPCDEYDFSTFPKSERDPHSRSWVDGCWKQFYEMAAMNPPPWNPQAPIMDPAYGGGRNEKADPAPAPSREQIQEAIKADPSVRLAAREAIEEVDRNRRENPLVDPYKPAASTMDDFARLVIDLQAAKRNLQSALTLTLGIHGFRQQDRRDAIAAKAQELRAVLDAIEEAAAGRSMDEELQQLLEEGAL